ncbi:basic helix-loop-helix (bHLH) DNA-bindingsuperfamily protein [Striga asiatica]|uniref:Basic helix-loop-helix (BHLH) DNA-bindingsuperfamily protein n=1 Tax=Striga asiatica TaxID=4170 RepID=A0A5A7PDR2_STRAF|nr:basic helix-loop-helix (bHLH) DNA-bindingsuperfamily protein [Striga asiatica]
MDSRKRISKDTAKPRRISSRTNRRLRKSGCPKIGGGVCITDKLEALKSLLPSENSEINTALLFQETADYIVRLKTQVFILQKLIDFYGSQKPQQNPNTV